MIETYDVKENMRPSDKIFHLLNYMNELKTKDVSLSDVLANIFENFGEVYANSVRYGKANEENIESCKSFLSSFIGENASKYLSREHKDLSRAAKGALENIDMAEMTLEQRNQFAKPVMSEEAYEKGYRRLG